LKIKDIIKRIGNVINDHKNEAIANELGVSPTTLSNWKTRGTIPWREVWEFCEKRHISFEQILAGTKLHQNDQSSAESAGEGANEGEDKFLMEKYEKIIKHYEVIIEQQARQIELLQQIMKSGTRATDPSDFDASGLRKSNPF
jgi:hypothetical protein